MSKQLIGLTVVIGRFLTDDGQLNRCIVRNVITASKLQKTKIRLNGFVIIF